jgi:hypothetical protein
MTGGPAVPRSPSLPHFRAILAMLRIHILLLPLILSGCLSFSSSSPSPPARNTTIIVAPPGSTISRE